MLLTAFFLLKYYQIKDADESDSVWHTVSLIHVIDLFLSIELSFIFGISLCSMVVLVPKIQLPEKYIEAKLINSDCWITKLIQLHCIEICCNIKMCMKPNVGHQTHYVFVQYTVWRLNPSTWFSLGVGGWCGGCVLRALFYVIHLSD